MGRRHKWCQNMSAKRHEIVVYAFFGDKERSQIELDKAQRDVVVG